MRVTNRASFPVRAMVWHRSHGRGAVVRIDSGQSAEVMGPKMGELEGEGACLDMSGSITCHEGSDAAGRDLYQVLAGKRLLLADDDGARVEVWHHEDNSR